MKLRRLSSRWKTRSLASWAPEPTVVTTGTEGETGSEPDAPLIA